MRLGVFTALLSHHPLEDALATLKSLQIDAVELGTGNYPGDAHCKLSMLEDASALRNSSRS
jgi:sugar phosphate isomerase/epimerase